MCASGLNPLCSAYGHPFSTEASDVVVSNLELKQFLFSCFIRRPHRSVIGARIFCLSSEPKRAFLWRLQTFLPNLFSDLLCLSCQISPLSPPQPSGSIQVILVCSLLLGTETAVQPSVFKWLFFSAAYLFSISASFCPSPSPSRSPGSARPASGPTGVRPAHAPLLLFPPRDPLAFLLLFDQIRSFLLFALCREKWVLSTTSFVSPAFLCCLNAACLFIVNSMLLYSVWIVYQMKH